MSCINPIAKHEKGFTLVELSIVIVIIALIVAGIAAGQSLVSASKIKAQISDFNNFVVAYNTFKLTYNAIPGDMPNASTFWSGAPNGDGDKKITPSADSANAVSNENIKFFEHLSRAGLIAENYTNVWQLGIGYPALKINKSYGMIAAGYISGPPGAVFLLSDTDVATRYTAVLELNVARPAAAGSAYNDLYGVATPTTFANIDNKIDDGIARAGKFKAYTPQSGDPTCLDGSGNYLLTSTTDACMGEFIIAK
jgi:prepilin-type N-terminal cleavage/methylation domain-containing protein